MTRVGHLRDLPREVRSEIEVMSSLWHKAMIVQIGNVLYLDWGLIDDMISLEMERRWVLGLFVIDGLGKKYIRYLKGGEFEYIVFEHGEG